MKLKIFILVIGLLIGGEVFAQSSSAGAGANASATILSGISCTKDATNFTGGDLLFGTLIPSATAGTVTIAAQSEYSTSRTVTGGVTAVDYNSSNAYTKFGPVSFIITGEPGYAYSLTIPSNAISIVNGSNSMIVSNWTCSMNAGANSMPGTGTQSINIGAKLAVGASQVAGHYVGEFAVTVNY